MGKAGAETTAVMLAKNPVRHSFCAKQAEAPCMYLSKQETEPLMEVFV